MPTEREAIRKLFNKRPDLADFFRRKIEDGTMGFTEDMPTDEEITIVAGDDHGGVTGSKQTKCDVCEAAVWLSPSTLAMLTERKRQAITIKCLPCVLKELPAKMPDDESWHG